MIAAIKAFDTSAKVIFGLLVLGIVLSLAMAVFTMRGARNDARKADAGQTFAEGRTGAAQDASAVRDRADTRNNQITNDVQEGTADVRQAPDRSAATLAARRGVCRINPGAGPDCRLLLADPQRVD
ncbi:hypothetical protein [Brevundimonas pondensis]|uniref:Uncharacterized protein n=1 Tax=Brevundimonas pondensis TaxID=2774189 RepID=A0ABX7SM02_9CAUL|nr:hypothetical protein [Brevundimonas pondensis]QTC87910.1 hypothetical protein IFE19_00400 [Brevundimonas pondensis]